MKEKPKEMIVKKRETKYSKKDYISDLQKACKPIKKVEKPKSTSSKT